MSDSDLSTRELCAALGITAKTLYTWRKAGCPGTKRGKGRGAWFYDLDAVKAWMADQSVTGEPGRPPAGAELGTVADDQAPPRPGAKGDLASLTDAQVRRLAREADVRVKQMRGEWERLRVAKARGDLVPIDEVIREHTEAVSRVCARLLAVPGALAGPLARERDPREVERVLDDHLRRTLDGLADETLKGGAA